MKAFVPDPDSLSQLFLQQILAGIDAKNDLSPEAQLRCLEHLERAEKLVCRDALQAVQAMYADLVVELISLKSEITCLNKKLQQS